MLRGTAQITARISPELRALAQQKLQEAGLSFTRWLELELWDWIHGGEGHPESLERQMQALWAQMDQCSQRRLIQWLQAQQ